jgi:outer membrane immunogenic protein
MRFNSSVLTIMFGTTLAISPTFAQEESAHPQEITVQGTGSFVTTTQQDGVKQSATNTGGFLASYRFFFNQHNGVEVNYGFENNTQIYGASGSLGGVGTRSHEVTAAYVLRYRLKRIAPFASAGVGSLVFDPKDFAGSIVQARPAFVYGAGADIRLSQHWFVRGEYRGLVYDSPTYGIAAFNGLDRLTHRAEPSLGFGFRY